MQKFKGCFQGLNDVLKHFSSLSDVLWFSKRFKNFFIIIDSSLEFSLQFFLRHSNKEMSNQLWDSLSYCTKDNFEISIYSGSDLFNEQISTIVFVWWLSRRWLLLGLVWQWLPIWTELRWSLRLWIFLRYDRSAVQFIIFIICEDIVLLSINYSFHDVSAVITFCL